MRRQSFFIILSLLLTFGGLFAISILLPTAHGKVGSQGACTLEYDKSASPTNVDAGGASTITFALHSVGDCTGANSPADVILVLDRSTSMQGQALADAKAAAIGFVDQMDLNVDQVGIASFSYAAELNSPLSQDENSIRAAIKGLSASGATNIIAGLEIAETELITSGHHIPSNAPVIILLSDGHHSYGGSLETLYQTAARIKGEGIRIISIGLGNIDESQLRTIASSDDDYYYAPTSSNLDEIYDGLADEVRVAARNMILSDTLSSYTSLLSDTFRGPILPTVNGNQIIWEIAAVSTNSLTLSYQVAMTESMGTWPTNENAIASYINAAGNRELITFPIPEVTVNATCGAPTLNQVQPAWGCEGADIEFELWGSGFFEPSVHLGTPELSLTTIESDYLRGTLTNTLNAGSYDATVTNSCQSSATLSETLTIYPSPEVLSVQPSAGYSDLPSTLTVCGTPFAPGSSLSIQLLTDTIPLEDQTPYGNQCLVGTVPVGLPAGDYPIIVDGACGSASTAYTIIDPTLNDDLWAESHKLWLGGDEPAQTPHLNEDLNIGLIVNRRGGRETLQDVIVRFYEGNPQSPNAVEINDGVIYLMPPRIGAGERISGTSTTAVDWNPSQGAGEYTLYAVIDPDDDITEDIEGNNVISRTVLVLADTPGVDQVAPRVDVLRINDTISTTTVYDPIVQLHVESQDFVQSGVTMSGVSQMLFVEYIFHQSAFIWVPIRSSGWLPFAQESSWELHPQAGLHFIQAWTVDEAGNISRYANQKSVNYLRPSITSTVARYGTNIYRQDAEAGEKLHVEVIPTDGDPDLYIWPPDWQAGQPAWVSNQENNIEDLTIPITTSGEYQIEVYGYTNAEYNIAIEVLPAETQQMTSPEVVIEHRTGEKTPPQAPVIPTNSAPDNKVLAAPLPEIKATPVNIFNLYLPAITR